MNDFEKRLLKIEATTDLILKELSQLIKSQDEVLGAMGEKRQAPPAPQWPQPSSHYVPLPAGFADTAFLIKKSEACTQEWAKVLDDFSKKPELSEKQLKLYKLIHFKCLGNWPSTKTAHPADKQPTGTPQDLADDVF